MVMEQRGTIMALTGAVIAFLILGITIGIVQEVLVGFTDTFREGGSESNETFAVANNTAHQLIHPDSVACTTVYLKQNIEEAVNKTVPTSDFTCTTGGVFTPDLGGNSTNTSSSTYFIDYTFTDRTTAFNASVSSELGVDKISGFQPTMAIVIAAVAVIAIVVIGFGAMKISKS